MGRRELGLVTDARHGTGSASHRALYTGCVVQALIARNCMTGADRLLIPGEGHDQRVYFFAVVGIFEVPDCEDYPWAVVVRCKVSERHANVLRVGYPETGSSLRPQTVYVMEL